MIPIHAIILLSQRCKKKPDLLETLKLVFTSLLIVYLASTSETFPNDGKAYTRERSHVRIHTHENFGRLSALARDVS